MAMHWGAEFLGGSGSGSNASPGSGVNGLTGAALCPRSKQPEFKHSAVRITKAALPWSLLAMAWLPEDEVLATHAALRTLMPQFAFAACVPFGRERSGVLLRAAAPAAPPDAVLTQIEQLLGLADAPALRYADRKTGQRRTMRLAPSGGDLLLQAFVLAGDTRAETWLRPLLQDALPAQPYGRLLLAPGAQAPITLAAASPQVCTCFNVREDAILSCLASCHGSEEGRLAALQQQLQCGTNCGSCIPQLRRLVRRSLPSAAAAA
jgi:assimilatory nitrate reductase catalytic subunit